MYLNIVHVCDKVEYNSLFFLPPCFKSLSSESTVMLINFEK